MYIFVILFLGTDKNWIHPPDTLQKGHIAYLVKVKQILQNFISFFLNHLNN